MFPEARHPKGLLRGCAAPSSARLRRSDSERVRIFLGNTKKARPSCEERAFLAHPKGFEPLTPRFVVWCSIQLSYGCALEGGL